MAIAPKAPGPLNHNAASKGADQKCAWKAKPRSEQPRGTDGAQGKAKGKGKGSRGSLRRPVLALCKVQDPREAEELARCLKRALLEADASEESVDGGLLGMAAAHAGRLGLKDVVDSLCAFAWSRLSACQGREVAEMTAAASRCCCDAERFLQFVIVYCGSSPERFSCLRDVALVSAALTSASAKLDVASAFEGLCEAANVHLSTGRPCARDICEFFYALATALGSQPCTGGPALCQRVIVIEVVVALSTSLRPLLHRASAQDIAKAMGGAAAAWLLMPNLQSQVLTPLLQDLAQAVRFRSADFNMQDLSQILVAFAKVDTVEELSARVLEDQIVANISGFKPKELCLTLWAIARPGFLESSLTKAALGEVQKRDLTQFSVQDLCMSAQALAKLGSEAKAALCVVAGEVFARHAAGFSSTDKVLLLWALAKSKVVHLALARLLVRDLAVEPCRLLPRDKISLALWSLAVLWPSLKTSESWSRLLASWLLAAQPWQMALDREVTNAAWAFRQLPPEIVAASWDSLLQSMMWLNPSSLSNHELCNLLAGLVACPLDTPVLACLLSSVGAEVVHRCNGNSDFSGHDKHLLAFSFAADSVKERMEKLGLQSLMARVELWRCHAGEACASRPGNEKADECQPQPEETRTTETHSENAEDDIDVPVWGQPQDTEADEAVAHPPPVPADGRWRHLITSSCKQTCCAPVPGTSELSQLRLNSHCEFHGHCVQLKHTFIHVECSTNSDSEDDCMLCNITRRPRARSLDLFDGSWTIPRDRREFIAPGGLLLEQRDPEGARFMEMHGASDEDLAWQ